jgi:molybdopterin-synthase adenylyltransferase
VEQPQDHIHRYHRQMLLPGIGEAGQQRLAAARVLIVGVGALGCASADLLARAGVGSITLLDRDLVDWTNLHRQVLFDEDDARAGAPKAEAAAARLARINSNIELTPMVRDLTPANAEATIRETRPQFLIDGTDNLETRYLLNDLSVKHQVPYAYAGAVSTHGLAALFTPGNGPCLRCIFEDPAAPGTMPTCDTAGVLGAAVTVIAGIQAAAVIRSIATGENAHKLAQLDVWTGALRTISIANAKRPGCPCCGARRFDFLSASTSDSATLCGQNAVQISPARPATLDLGTLAQRLTPHGKVSRSRFFVRCSLAEGLELTVFPDARAIIRGTTRLEQGRSLYARLVGS